MWSTPLSRASSTTTVDDEEASKYIKSYRLDGTGRGSSVDILTETGHTLATDVPLKMGGNNSAPQPVETLLAAWMGCTQATAFFVGRQMKPTRIVIDRLEFVNIRGFRDERGALMLPIEEMPDIPSRLQKITGTIRVLLKRGQLSKDQLELLKEQTEARCPVANMMLSSGCYFDVDWVVLDGEN
jgi:putative redox protein